MSAIPMFPFSLWQSGTNENSIPANDNSLRSEVLTKEAINFASSEPVAPGSREIYVVSAAWDDFVDGDVVIYIEGTWYGYSPFDGWTKLINGQLYVYSGSGGWDIFAGTGTGIVESVVAGSGISVDSSDPANPIVSSSGGSGGGYNAMNCNNFPTSGSAFYFGDESHSALAAFTVPADTVYYFPFVVGENITLSLIGTVLMGTAASGKCRVGIYNNSVTSGKHSPSGSPIVESGDLSITTTGLKTTAVSQPLTSGTVYWAALLVNASVSILSAQAATLKAILGRISTSNHNQVTSLNQTVAAGWTALPISPASLIQGTSSRPVVYATFS